MSAGQGAWNAVYSDTRKAWDDFNSEPPVHTFYLIDRFKDGQHRLQFNGMEGTCGVMAKYISQYYKKIMQLPSQKRNKLRAKNKKLANNLVMVGNEYFFKTEIGEWKDNL